MVRVVRAQSAEDQEEVGSCLEAALLGLAAARLALQEYGAAAAACKEELGRDGGNVTALLRRARALKGLHELQVRYPNCLLNSGQFTYCSQARGLACCHAPASKERAGLSLGWSHGLLLLVQ